MNIGIRDKQDCRTLTDLIEVITDRPDRVAFRYRTRFRTREWTYMETFRHLQKVRELFREHGIEQGDPLLLWGPNSPYWAFVYLAALYNGSPIVPVDMGSHVDFVEKLRNETGARLLFSSRLNETVPGEITEIQLEELPEILDRIPFRDRPPARVHPDDKAQIIYTSGTTGQPKGTILTHRNMISNQENLEQGVEVDLDRVRVVSVLPLSHAFEQTVGFWYPFRNAGMITYIQTLKPSEITGAMQDERPNMMVAVPRLLELFRDRIVDELEEKGVEKWFKKAINFSREWLNQGMRRMMFAPIINRLGGDLSLFVVGGAPLAPELEEFWDHIGIPVYQGYGLTETAPILTCNSPGERKMGTVGKPLPGVSLKIGEDGEILARGDNVFPGYFNRPEITREAFDDGWFRTGDIGELVDGYLKLKGRKKNVIVTDEGLNVYPEDIEEHLDQASSVEDSCVLQLNNRITAVFLPGDDEFDPDEVIEKTNRQLSEHQKIQDWNIWPEDDFPRTTTMKIRRDDVRKRFEDADEKEEEPASFGRARGEEDVFSLLARTAEIPVEQIETDDKLGADLGLSSIDRLELVTHLEEQRNVDLDETAVTGETTAGDLRERVENRAGEGEEDALPHWPRTGTARLVRSMGQNLFLQPLIRNLYNLEVKGTDKLTKSNEPLIIIANHTSHLDTPVLMDALPDDVSSRLAVATWAEYFELGTSNPIKRLEKSFLWYFTSLFYNIFPMPQESGFRRTMEYIGHLLDNNWNVLLYPEGQRTIDGTMHDFRRGIGFIARHMDVPIVPARLDGLDDILPRWKNMPRPGRASVQFDAPQTDFKHGSYREIGYQLQQKIESMGPKEKRPDRNRVSITVYDRENCPLCHEVKQDIAMYADRYPLKVTTLNLKEETDRYEEYKNSVPVVFVGQSLASKGELNDRRFRRLVEEELDRVHERAEINGETNGEGAPEAE